MKTVAAVIGRWADIFNYYGLPPITGKKHYQGECPICGRKGKFRIDNKEERGEWICTCGAGDGWKLLELTQKKDFKTLAREIDQLIGNTYQPQQPQSLQPVQEFRSRVISKFSTLLPLRDTDARNYFANRGIYELPVSHLRFNPHEKTHDGIFQSLWAVATDDKGAGCYLHRTLLDNGKKAPIAVNKKMSKLQDDNYLNFSGSVAIRMFPVSTTLGVAEGIETALSCKQTYGCNTWSTLNAGFLRKFRAPTGVKHLIIFADTDPNGAGLAAAFECGHRNMLHNNEVELVSIRWPERGDFNDMLQNGAKVYQQQLSKTEAA
ncbi:primase-helicase zinc-binding domain-containing protein [Sodalis endosymbiont of Spalangia cameroni]|uniref:primase-helicase zinc-binding domain-containing protein n=1 Tax=Sodalis praecaptivus TaxID=1239307 RepID=UPI0031F7255F